MGYVLSEYNMPSFNFNEAILEMTVVRAKQEHELLRQQLKRIHECVRSVRSETNEQKLLISLRLMRAEVQQFLSDWRSHGRWERVELFPYVSWYLGLEPDLCASIDKEYGLADKYMNTYLAIAKETSVQPDTIHRMTSYLLQAYAVLLNRFMEEEDMMNAAMDHSH